MVSFVQVCHLVDTIFGKTYNNCRLYSFEARNNFTADVLFEPKIKPKVCKNGFHSFLRIVVQWSQKVEQLYVLLKEVIFVKREILKYKMKQMISCIFYPI